MVVETQTDASVEQSATAVEQHQESATAVPVSEEPLEKVNVDVHHDSHEAPVEEHHEPQNEPEQHTVAVTEVEGTTEKSTEPVEEHQESQSEVVELETPSEESPVPASVSAEPEQHHEDAIVPEERSVATEEVSVTSEQETAQAERTVPPVEEAATVNHVQEAPAKASDPADPMELPKFIYTAMEKVACEQGFTAGQYKIEFDVGSNKGDGFVGQMFKAFLSEGDRREVYLCKIPPLNEARRQQFPTMIIFTRETMAYSKLLPLMFAYQEEKGVSREDGFFNVPKCYYAECDEAVEESVIIMEDLRLDGYRMWDKMVPVNYEHARLTMEQIGRLHAVSLALKRDRPDQFEQFKVPDPMKEMMPVGGPFEGMMRQMILDSMETLEPHETAERAKLQKLHDNLRPELEGCSNPDLAEPHTVFGHGDCWVNNFMFHYKNGAPEKIVLLDWQISRYVTPVLDLVYFLFCCTDGEFRARHYDEMMNIYYNSLTTLLEKLGHKPQEVFPRTALMRQLRRFGRFGYLMAVFLVPMLCTRNEDLPDMDEAAEKFRETNNADMNHFTMNANKTAYHKRMSAVIRDTIRYGYL